MGGYKSDNYMGGNKSDNSMAGNRSESFKLTIDMDLELLSSIVRNPVERLANIRAHVDPETGNEDPETT